MSAKVLFVDDDEEHTCGYREVHLLFIMKRGVLDPMIVDPFFSALQKREF